MRSAVRTLFMFLLVATTSALAQQPAALSGTITAAPGKPVRNARVSIKNLDTGKTETTQTNATGDYSFSQVASGEYELDVSAAGFGSEAAKVTLAPGAQRTMSLALSPALSLQGLGFPSSETQGNAQEQARLDKRSHMLKIHQRLGLITTVPLVATLFTGNLAGGRSSGSTGRNVHVALGAATAGLYFTTASFAIFAPKIEGTQTRGPIRLHKFLAWIHGPGMVLTPILGAMAYEQKANGERVHGIASAHGAVAIVTAGAYGAAILSVTLRMRHHGHK